MKSILRTFVSLILCASLAAAPTAPVVVNPNTSVLVSPTAAALAAANTLFVITSGTYANPAWITSLAEAKVLPSQTGNSGKYLTTNGTASSWVTLSTGLTVATTAITGGTSGRVLYNNAGVLGEMTTSGSGTVLALTTSPTFVTPALGTPASGDFSTGAFTWPTFDQNTTGSAATLTTTRTIGGSNFNGSADVTSFPSPGAIGGTTPSTIAGTTGTFSGELSTTGAAAYLATYGAAAHIYTDGANAQIYTSGTNASISTGGSNAHISTGSSGAYIQSRSTFRLNSGTFITTLSHAPTANRAIAFPDAAGTLALVSGDLGTPSAIALTNASGTLPAGVTIPLGTVTLTGTLPDARLSANVPLLNASNTYTGTTNSFTIGTSTGVTTGSGVAFSANALTTGTGIYLASSSLTSGKAMDIQVSGTAAAASQTALNIATAGANGTSGITTKGAVISNTHTGTTSTNTALELTASGGTTNVALLATAGHVLVPDGSFVYNTSVSPSIGRSAVAANSTSQAAILLGDNAVSILTNSIRGFTISGYGAFGNGPLISHIGSPLTFSNTVISATGFQAAENKTSTPNTGTLIGGSGSGTNIAGGALHIIGGASTGSAAGGSILIRTTPAGGSGSSANAAVTAITIDSTQAVTLASTLAVTGSSVLTGNLTSNGALISTPEALAPALDAGAAVGVTTLTSTIAVNGTNAVTLANGTGNGQIKTIVCTAVTSAGTATVTPTTANGFTSIAFTAAGQSVTLQYFTTGGWVILSVRNATIAALGDAQRHRCTGEALALCA